MSPAMRGSGPGGGIDVIPFAGWPNNLRLGNGAVELIATLVSKVRCADPSNLRSGREEFRTVNKLDLFTTSLGVQEL